MGEKGVSEKPLYMCVLALEHGNTRRTVTGRVLSTFTRSCCYGQMTNGNEKRFGIYLPAELFIEASRLFQVFVTSSSKNSVPDHCHNGEIVPTKEKLSYSHVNREPPRGFVMTTSLYPQREKCPTGK